MHDVVQWKMQLTQKIIAGGGKNPDRLTVLGVCSLVSSTTCIEPFSIVQHMN